MAVGFPAKTNFATGDVLTATNVNDITGTLNLLQETLYPAGRNKIINGDFAINQRNFTSTTTSGTYMFDRWVPTFVGGGATCSSQVATVGTSLGNTEVTNYLKTVTTGQTGANVATFPLQKIEDVRTFANQTVLVSFWAKAATGTPKIAVEFSQFFNSALGGSATVQAYGGQVTLTTDWARYSVSVTLPSITGKTIATGNALVLNLWVSAGTDFSSRTGSLGIQSNTFDIWGVQVEAASTGSTASPFQTASGSIGGELALCQRYYSAGQSIGIVQPTADGGGNFRSYNQVTLPVTMRTVPTVAITSYVAGTVNKVTSNLYAAAYGGAQADSTGTASGSNIGTTSFVLNGIDSTNKYFDGANWTATAEL